MIVEHTAMLILAIVGLIPALCFFGYYINENDASKSFACVLMVAACVAGFIVGAKTLAGGYDADMTTYVRGK